MHSLVHVGARFDLETPQRIQHRLWHLRRCRAVEVMQLWVGEPRKLTLNRCRIESVDMALDSH
jgi:hypothetical protein